MQAERREQEEGTTTIILWYLISVNCIVIITNFITSLSLRRCIAFQTPSICSCLNFYAPFASTEMKANIDIKWIMQTDMGWRWWSCSQLLITKGINLIVFSSFFLIEKSKKKFHQTQQKAVEIVHEWSVINCGNHFGLY